MCGSNAGTGNHSTCGSYFNAEKEDFPAVPYSAWDFNDAKCKSRSGDIEDYQDAPQVNLVTHFYICVFLGYSLFLFTDRCCIEE